jgi:hypothetical protein
MASRTEAVSCLSILCQCQFQIPGAKLPSNLTVEENQPSFIVYTLYTIDSGAAIYLTFSTKNDANDKNVRAVEKAIASVQIKPLDCGTSIHKVRVELSDMIRSTPVLDAWLWGKLSAVQTTLASNIKTKTLVIPKDC